MSNTLLTILGVLLILLLLTVFAGYYFSNIVIFPKTIPYDETYKRCIEKNIFDEKQFKNLEKEEIYIDSPFGYKLHGIFFPNNDAKKVMILCHGITWSLNGSIKYMEMFLKRGFAVLIYDHRNHGLSGGTDTSFGFYEKYDLKACIDWVEKKFGKGTIIGLHGESMGSGVLLETIAIDDRITFAIEDCGYCDLEELLKHRLSREYHIKYFPMVKLASFVTKIRKGWKFSDVSALKHISKVNIPMMFIHGELDDYVPTYMSKKMYDMKKGSNDLLYIAPNAAHAQAYLCNMKEYEEKVDSFLKNINVI
ncbi:MAG: alpha/beta hydrolase [Caloramator sp.]|nr:alpha/beta hydrolase [Caloramator sp.]